MATGHPWSPPNLTTPAADICDPMLLLARVGYRAYLLFSGSANQPTCTNNNEMLADLARLTVLLDNTP